MNQFGCKHTLTTRLLTRPYTMMWCKWQTAWRWLLSRRCRPGSNELATLLFKIATDFIKVNAGWEARRMGRHYSMQISRTYLSLLCFRVQNLLYRLWMSRRRLYSCSLWSGRAGVCPLLAGELASRSTWFIRSALYVGKRRCIKTDVTLW